MEWKEFTAKSVEEALTDAAVSLQIPSSMVEYEILEEGKNGFMGLFSKPAKIRARAKDEEPVTEESVPIEDINSDTVVTRDLSKEQGTEYKKEGVGFTEKTRSASELSGGNEKHKQGSMEAEEKKPIEDVDVEQIVNKFLSDVFIAMNIEAKIKVKFDREENIAYIDVEGTDMGILIGKRGQTLDSLQYLTSLVINKETSSYIKVKMDTENYRARRKETLENLARNIAFKVKRTKRSVSLEPMNPYERRIIHAALQNDRYVETHSEGEEPYRKVVITLKKGYRDFSNRYNGHGRSYGNKREYKNSLESNASEKVTGE